MCDGEVQCLLSLFFSIPVNSLENTNYLNKKQLSSTVINIVYFHCRWFWSGRSNSGNSPRFQGYNTVVFREPFDTFRKQKLLVALAVISVAYSINKWIRANRGEEEKRCEMVEWSFYLCFSRNHKEIKNLVREESYE